MKAPGRGATVLTQLTEAGGGPPFRVCCLHLRAPAVVSAPGPCVIQLSRPGPALTQAEVPGSPWPQTSPSKRGRQDETGCLPQHPRPFYRCMLRLERQTGRPHAHTRQREDRTPGA